MPDSFGTVDGPESMEEMEIPGFPKPKKAEGFTNSLQVLGTYRPALFIKDRVTLRVSLQQYVSTAGFVCAVCADGDGHLLVQAERQQRVVYQTRGSSKYVLQ